MIRNDSTPIYIPGCGSSKALPWPKAIELWAKSVVDVGLAALGLVVLSPLLLLVALAIRLNSTGPALFKQTRTGLDGRPFRIYKFRTMTVQEDGPVVNQATQGDPRVT